MERHVADELPRRQDLLRQEASEVLGGLNLFALLAPAGEVTQVGSSGVGLMTRRDIDICVVRDTLSADGVRGSAPEPPGNWSAPPSYGGGSHQKPGRRASEHHAE
jgi:hypothetical protein